MLTARLGLIRIEAKDFARITVRRVVFAAAAAVSILFAWGLLVAGAAGVVVMFTGWPWGYVLLGAAGIHLLAALACGLALRSPSGPSFPLTREEFQKDRAWLHTLQETRKSND